MPGNDSYTKILMHFDSSVTADVAVGTTPSGWSNVDAATIGTTSPTPKIGAGSLHLVASSFQGVVTSDLADWSPSGDFTIDCWIYWDGTAATICAHFDASLNGWFWGPGYTAGKLLFQANILAGGSALTSAASVPTNTWTHVAVVSVGGVIKQFINGTLDANTLTHAVQSATANFSIGYQAGNSSQFFNGNIDEFRFSNGIARWTSNFTPQTTAYGATYSVVASAGAYALSGVAAALNKGKTLVAAAGSYALTGTAVLFHKTLHMVAASGSYAMTGVAAIVKRALQMTAASGSYALTGVAAAFRRNLKVIAATGTYAVTGVAATVKKALRFTAAPGAYALTGKAAVVRKDLHLIAAKGTYLVTGFALAVARFVAPASKFSRRLAAPILYRVRKTPPTL